MEGQRHHHQHMQPSPCDVVCVTVHVVSVVCSEVWCCWCVSCVFGVSQSFRLPREVHQRNRWILPISSLRIGRTRHVSDPSIIRFTCSTPALFKKHTKKKHPLDGSICLSLQEAECKERYARQCRYEPPLEIILTLPFSRCVHQLSGPNTCALTQTTFKITENTHTCCYHDSSRTQPH